MAPPLAPLVKSLIDSLGVPATALWGIQHYAEFTLNSLQLFLVYIASVAAYLYGSATFARWRVVRRAHKAGAQVIPRVVGRYVGNIDILREAMRRYSLETPGTYFQELAAQVGSTTFDSAVLGGTFIATTDPLIVKHMLTGNSFNNYEKGPFFNKVFEDFLGSGIFNSDRDMWKAHRNMTRPYFVTEKTSDFDTFNHHTDHLINTIEKLSAAAGSSAMHSKGAVEVQDLFGRYTLDAATAFLMGGAVSSLSEVGLTGSPAGASTDFLMAFNRVQHNCGKRARLGPIWPLWELRTNANTQPMSVISPMVDGLIEKALARTRTVNEKGEETGSLLDSLIQKTRDPKVLKDQVLNILLAARDTTMSTLSSAVYSLARDPKILAKLRAEVLTTIGKDAAPTYEDARGMKYLRAFVNEVLRMFPPVPFNVRSSIGDDVCVDHEGVPRFIPAGTRMSYSLFNMQRRTDLWGPDALTFDPERWLDQRNDFYKSNPFIFQPFSAGARICLGQNFAYNEVSFALIRLLQQYSEIAIAYDVQPPHTLLGEGELLLVSQITLMFTGGLWVRMTKAT